MAPKRTVKHAFPTNLLGLVPSSEYDPPSPSYYARELDAESLSTSQSKPHPRSPPPAQPPTSHDQENTTDVTKSALHNLFADPSVPQAFQIDPSLANEHSTAHYPPTSSSTMDGNFDLGPTLSSHVETGDTSGNAHQAAHIVSPDNSSPADQPSTGDTGAEPKRKATSRANMLARGGACEFCKRRKLKCSAEVPTCSACRRSGVECVYSQKKQRSRVRVLEDRLVELERRLAGNDGPESASSSGPNTGGDVSSSAHAHGSAQDDFLAAGVYISPETHDSTNSGAGASAGFDSAPDTGFFNISDDPALTLGSFPGINGGGAAVGVGMGNTGGDARPEPDLMTLADAAAADGSGAFPWEGMGPKSIVDEVLKAAQGGGGIGEKIIAHLLQYYGQDLAAPFLHVIIPPANIFARIFNRSRPPHPSLTLALLPQLMPFSLSPALSHPSLPDLLLAASARLANTAFATLDPRPIDIVFGNLLRAGSYYILGRFIDGWTEIAGVVALAWAAGLGKLGNVGEMFSGPGEDRAARVARDARARMIRYKGQVVPPIQSVKELSDRINLFWLVYTCEKMGGIGWNWPSSTKEEEITTPLPRDDYVDNPTALRDAPTLKDFLEGRVVGSATDSPFCSEIKAVCLAAMADRIQDIPPTPETKARAAQILRVATDYLDSLKAYPKPIPMPEASAGEGPLNQARMCLHMAIFFVHCFAWENSVDDEAESDAALDRAIVAAEGIVTILDGAYADGNFNLDGYNILGSTIWVSVGRSAFYVERGLSSVPRHRARVERFGVIGSSMLKALQICGKRSKVAEVQGQMVHNMSLGEDTKIGEWARQDNI